LTIRSTIRPYMTMAEGLAFSKNANLLLSATSHGTAYMWILPWGIQVPTLAWFQDRRELNTNVVYFNHLSSMAGGSENRLLVWDTFSGRLLAELEGHRSWISRIALSPDEKWVASSALDGMVKVWDLHRLREARTLDGHGGSPVRSLCWSADGQVLLSGANDRRIFVWELDRPEQYRQLERAVAAAQAALVQHPEDPAALTTLGRWYAFRGHDDWAVQMFAKAIAGGADVSPLLLARSLWKQGRTAEALDAFNAALRKAGDPQEKFYLTLCRDAVRASERGSAALIAPAASSIVRP
ncbi:MAG TPA: hypothetical protein VN541_21255, partial [Tepidisphaeraceae bacterium]|nr:hypothetical protein [Tepidisphaeraceae bacterium]